MPTSSEIAQLSNKYVGHFNACVKDSDRIASLILLGKLLKHENCTAEIRRTVFRKMDMSFVVRMLNLNSVVTDEEGSTVSLQTVAISIFQYWFCDEELMTSDSFLKLLNKFCQIIISSHCEDKDGSSTCVADVYQGLNCMMDYVGGRVAVLEQNVVPVLCQAIVNECQDFEKSVDILKCLSQCHEGVLWDLYATDMHQVMSTLVDIVRRSKDLKTFSYFEDMQVLLLGLNSDTDTPPLWLEDLSTVLLNALKSEIGPQQRRSCLRLAAELARIWAFDWLLVHTPQDMFLLIQMTAIESSVIMEYSVSFEKTFPQADVLIPCFTLLETTLQWLSSSEGPPAPDFMSRLIGRLDDTFAALSRMLVRWMKDVATVESCWRDRESTTFLYAAARVLGVWLAQDEWAKSEAERLPSDLLIAIRDLGVHSLGEEDEMEDGIDVIRFFLPGLCLTSADESQREALIHTGWTSLVARYTVNRIKRMKGGVEEISQSICSALNVIFNFLLEGKWLAEFESLVAIVAERWHNLIALTNWKLSLHLVLFVTSVMPLQAEKLSNRCKLNAFDTLLSIFEKVGKSSYRRNPCVSKEWEDVEGLWLLSAQIFSEYVDGDSSFLSLMKSSGCSQTLDLLVEGINGSDPCYKSLAGIKAILISPSDASMDL